MMQNAHSISPPAISAIVRNNDSLQPSDKQEEITLEKSRAYWYHIATLADSYLDSGLPPEFTNPQYALHKVPRLRGQLKSPFQRPLGTTATFALCSLASSTWKLVGETECHSIKREIISRPTLVQIGTRTAIPFSFRGDVFAQWVGATGENTTGPNYLGVLAIGWCYVLSACLVEMQGDGAIVRYTNSLAAWSDDGIVDLPEDMHLIDIGEADANPRIVRWWCAVLAKGKGWEAMVRDGPANRFVTPWTVSRTCESSFIIRHRSDFQNSAQTPLSSDDAFDALQSFARLHGLGSQFSVALAIALSFPIHRYYGTEVKLPFPTTHHGRISASITNYISPQSDLKEQLPYYMTLSCCPDVMISTLCGAFWQPDVPCNMVSQWLHPALKEVTSYSTEIKAQEVIGLIGAIRRPSVAALWIGAAISGIAPKLLQKVGTGRPPLDSVGFPWTGASQGFMDYPGTGPYTCDDSRYIARPDVWRLLHLSSIEDDELSYENRPMTPWEPCGVSLTTDCALRVPSHLKCPRHELGYDHWTWELENGETELDYGYSRDTPALVCEPLSKAPEVRSLERVFDKKELDADREASGEASVDIFRWFVLGGEGLPREDIYNDDWLRGQWDMDDDGDEIFEKPDADDLQGNGSQNQERIEKWLDIVHPCDAEADA